MVTRSCGGEREGCPHPTHLMQGQQALLGCIREEIWQHRLQCALNTPRAPHIPPGLRSSTDASAKPPLLCQAVAVAPLRKPHLRLQHYTPPDPAGLVAGPRFPCLRAEP